MTPDKENHWKYSGSKLSRIFLELLQVENNTSEEVTVENPTTKKARKTKKTIKKKLEEWRNHKRAGKIKKN